MKSNRYSLVELFAAIIIFAFLMVTILQLFTRTQDLSDSNNRSVEIIKQARYIIDAIENDFNAVVVNQSAGDEMLTFPELDQSSDPVIFTAHVTPYEGNLNDELPSAVKWEFKNSELWRSTKKHGSNSYIESLISRGVVSFKVSSYEVFPDVPYVKTSNDRPNAFLVEFELVDPNLSINNLSSSNPILKQKRSFKKLVYIAK